LNCCGYFQIKSLYIFKVIVFHIIQYEAIILGTKTFAIFALEHR